MREASDYVVGEVVDVDTSVFDDQVHWTMSRVTKIKGQIVTVEYIDEPFYSSAIAVRDEHGGEFFEDCVRKRPHGRIAKAVRKRHEHKDR